MSVMLLKFDVEFLGSTVLRRVERVGISGQTHSVAFEVDDAGEITAYSSLDEARAQLQTAREGRV